MTLRDETFWIIAPGAGVLLLLAAMILFIGRWHDVLSHALGLEAMGSAAVATMFKPVSPGE
ncbi:hypothetical protein J2R87_002303 [Bradyrhizobium elkanii]|nr:hypothetical protein [Bradyrhizobium elkanii]MCS4109935.1 hypothetical protein [Bradyrhizobium elkanii]